MTGKQAWPDLLLASSTLWGWWIGSRCCYGYGCSAMDSMEKAGRQHMHCAQRPACRFGCTCTDSAQTGTAWQSIRYNARALVLWSAVRPRTSQRQYLKRRPFTYSTWPSATTQLWGGAYIRLPAGRYRQTSIDPAESLISTRAGRRTTGPNPSTGPQACVVRPSQVTCPPGQSSFVVGAAMS